METIAEKLELLLRTKERQKAYLQQKYPLLDFDTIPFRAYLDLFQGRSYIPGFVGGWKAYGRSNDEDASTRDILPDYSGNGRDIKLYNFAFAGMSGYGGYGTSKWICYGSTLIEAGKITQVDSNTVHMSVQGSYSGVYLGSLKEGDNFKIKYKISGIADITYHLALYINSSDGVYLIRPNITDGEYEDTISAENYKTYYGVEEIPAINQIFLVFRNNSYVDGQDVTLQQLPLYPGALVSDGVDDYGQCIKNFALPDDYTVVAIRKIIDPSIGSALSGKSRIPRQGAFIIDYYGKNAYSYGGQASNLEPEPLFSYLTKTSYNGRAIQPGTGTDTEEDKVYLFTVRGGYPPTKAALYDLRIYDHSLTAEELQTVKDEMMSDFEKATGGGIADITYVADWDGKGRSNDEDADVRSQWIDKATGKVINLSNYSFSEMSGWGGYAIDFTTIKNRPDRNHSTITKTQIHTTMIIAPNNAYYVVPYEWVGGLLTIAHSQKFRISGFTGSPYEIWFAWIDENNHQTTIFKAKEDGVYESAVIPSNNTFIVFQFRKKDGGAFTANESIPVNFTIELLPLYPGALVSDGVDDYIKAEEAFGKVGTVLIHWKNIGLRVSRYLYNTGWENDAGRLYCWNTQGTIACGRPHMQMDGHPIMIYHRSPLVSTVPLNNNAGENNCPICRLIFIKEQLDEYQQEFLEWKVVKEYRDWCRANGYDYAIPEMTSATN